MQYSFALFAFLGVASATSLIAYGYPGLNSTSVASSSTSTTPSGSVISPYSSLSSLSSTSSATSTSTTDLRPYPTDGAPVYLHPTGGAPVYPRPSGGIWPIPHPIPTGGDHHQPTSSSNGIPGSGYTTKTTTYPITTTITRHVPCSTEVHSNGQTWWSTYLTTAFQPTTYMTTKTVIDPVPTEYHPAPWYNNDCPTQATVTSTVTQYIGLPSPQPEPEHPNQYLTTKTLTLTLDDDSTTTITVSYTVPATTTPSTLPNPPYPYPSKSDTPIGPGGYPHPTAGGYPHPTAGGYAHSTGVVVPPPGYSHTTTTKPVASGYRSSSASTAVPTYY